MRSMRGIGVVFLLLAAGCASVARTPPAAAPQPGANQDRVATPQPAARQPEPAVPAPQVRAGKPPAPDSAAGRTGSGEKPASRREEPAEQVALPVPTAEAAARNSDTPAVKPEPPAPKGAMPAGRTDTPVKAPPPEAPPVKPAATLPAPAALPEKTAKPASAAQAPAKPAQPPALDLAALEKRLKDTNAIGVFTKLTLKNQVDDLLNRFKAFYEGRLKTTLAELRQPYDLLILKVLTLLQDGDPPLARAVHDSREAIWGILSDPVKFSKLQS